MFSAIDLLIDAASKPKSSSGSYILVIYVILFGAFYYFYIRPRSKKTKAARQVNSQVEVGDRVQTIGGVVGIVSRIENDLVTVRSSSGHEHDFLRRAIAQKLPDPVTDSVGGDVIDDDPNFVHGDDTDAADGGDEH